MKLSKGMPSALLMGSLALVSMNLAHAAVITISQASLTATTQLYTDQVGGGIGNIVVMTGGGNAAGIGDPTGRNDDGFSGPINLGFSLDFFGSTYTQFWINNNGNISFGGGISAFTPTGPQGATQPIISPFFADVDTRNPASGVVHLRQDTNQDIITWDNVGFYSGHGSPLDNFQLVLRSADYATPAGEGQIGFFWTTMGWETGDASGGLNGFGGTPAAVGFGDGLNNGYILEGSTQNGIAAVVQNHELWFNLSTGGVPVVVPPPSTGVAEPSTLALFGFGLLGFVIARRKLSC